MLRLKYEELFIFMLKINILKKNNRDKIIGHSKEINRELIDKFIDRLPFTLTDDQLTAVNDIFRRYGF